jgi:hypothetical protein
MKHSYTDSVLADAMALLGDAKFQSIFKSASVVEDKCCGDKPVAAPVMAADDKDESCADDFEKLLADDGVDEDDARDYKPGDIFEGKSLEAGDEDEREIGEILADEPWSGDKGDMREPIPDFRSLAAIVAHLVKASELLDRAGLSKFAASTLDTALIVEAKREEKVKSSKKPAKKDEKKAPVKDSKKDAKKDSKPSAKDEKKDVKAPVGKKLPFGKKEEKKPAKK